MLPAWATVLLALITAVAGIVGGLAIANQRIRFEREQSAETRLHELEKEWRDRLVAAADDFSTALVRARDAVGGLGDAMSREDLAQAASESADEAERQVEEAHARLGRVRLLFGYDTDPANYAADAIRHLRQAIFQLRWGGSQEADTRLDRAHHDDHQFNLTALVAIRRAEQAAPLPDASDSHETASDSEVAHPSD